MEKVVLYCRVSTQVQDYERQVSDLTQFAKKHQWEIAETFTEKHAKICRIAKNERFITVSPQWR